MPFYQFTVPAGSATARKKAMENGVLLPEASEDQQ